MDNVGVAFRRQRIESHAQRGSRYPHQWHQNNNQPQAIKRLGALHLPRPISNYIQQKSKQNGTQRHRPLLRKGDKAEYCRLEPNAAFPFAIFHRIGSMPQNVTAKAPVPA